MRLPWGDWQFWVGSLIVLGAAAWIGRGLMRALLPGKRGKQTRVSLTIKGEKPD